MTTTTIKAKRSGTCPSCGGPIEEGQEIEWAPGLAAYHSTCDAPPPPASEISEDDRVRVYGHLTELNLNGKLKPYTESLFNQLTKFGRLSDKQVKSILKDLKGRKGESKSSRPELPGLDVVPAGRYALRLEKDGEMRDYFLRVWRTPDGEYVKVYNDDSGNEIKWPTVVKALQAIVDANPGQAALRYGMLRTRCSRCGAKLEDPLSVTMHIGPTCVKYWFSPDKVAEMKSEARAQISVREARTAVIDRLKEKAEFAERERLQEQLAFESDPDYRR